MSSAPCLVVILGPTASGKSALGIHLAREFGGEVVVCDSAQVYRQFDIGTAKVREPERSGIPHWMMDLAEPGGLFTAGDYGRQAAQVIEEIRGRGRLPVLTAGTGLYLRALLEGLADAPARSEELRARLRSAEVARGREYIHRILRRLDRTAAARIGSRDAQKAIRAIEMRLLAGKTVEEIHGAGRRGLQGFHPLKLGLLPSRPQLHARIDARVEQMLAGGWREEVRTLLASGVPESAKPFRFIGYAEVLAHVQGKMTLKDARASIQQATRQLAKRQITWFRREREVRWLKGFGDDAEVAAEAREFVRAAISTE